VVRSILASQNVNVAAVYLIIKQGHSVDSNLKQENLHFHSDVTTTNRQVAMSITCDSETHAPVDLNTPDPS
jgi:hypothetical protein